MTAREPRAELVEAVARPWQADDFPGHDAYYRAQAVAVLAAVLPLLTPADVPHLEAAVREKVAGEIEAILLELSDTLDPEEGPVILAWAVPQLAAEIGKRIARDGGR